MNCFCSNDTHPVNTGNLDSYLEDKIMNITNNDLLSENTGALNISIVSD